MARRRYTYVGSTNERDNLGYLLHAFSCNINIPCEGDYQNHHDIPAGDVFTRAAWGQRTEPYSRWPQCSVCRPFTLAGS